MKVVYFDLETTGLNHQSRHEGVEICSIAAINRPSRQRFYQHLIPQVPFMPAASRVNGMTKRHGYLFKNGELVANALPIEDGLQEFLKFLRKIDTRTGDVGAPIILVAHNNFKFDGVVLKKNFIKYGYNWPANIMCADSMDLMRLVQQRELGLRRISLNDCLQYFHGEMQALQHDAMDDARHLQKICIAACQRIGYRTLEDFFQANPELVKPLSHCH